MDEADLSRADFLKLAATAVAGVTLLATGCGGKQPQASATDAATPLPSPSATPRPKPKPAYVAAAHGKDPAAITRAAVAAVGGIGRFVHRGADVIVKPNICTAGRDYRYAATTNPIVVATLVELCLEAGARRVRVMDSPFSGMPEAAYAESGIAAAVEKAGGKMELMSPLKYATTAIPRGRDLKSWPIYRDVMKADAVINVPIAKQHGSTLLTLGAKNLMGVVLDRGAMHSNLSQRIADLASVIRPTLTVVDAVRILTANGPTGGDLADVKRTNTVIASHDVVAADAYAATLFGLEGADIGYLAAASRMGLGEIHLDRVLVRRLKVA